MMEKQKIGGLMERGDLCLVEVMGFDWQPGKACGILCKFGQSGIPLSYLSIGNDASGNKHMSFCVGTALMAEHRHLVDQIREEFQPQEVKVNAPVIILTLYGPHFLEKVNLASEVFSALCLDCIRSHTVVSSVNSISVVVDVPDRDRTVACLQERFEWPE